jgi:hypothetical protein
MALVNGAIVYGVIRVCFYPLNLEVPATVAVNVLGGSFWV